MDLSQFKVRTFIIGIIALGLLVLVASFGINLIYKRVVSQTNENPIVSTFSTPTPVAGASTTPASPRVTPSPLTQTPLPTTPPRPGTIAQQPSTGPDDVEVSGAGIKLVSPVAGATLSSPANISGEANVMDGKVAIEARDDNGNVIGKATATACLGTKPCPFSASLRFDKTTTGGTLEVYNPRFDGTKLYLYSIPVNFK